ncbi:hypothetical protein [Paenisporosarcina sp. TG-14]|uniref:hypothetical protein n=1 Tax=Paenisporosarcina sp. TG-14 TaxID=1231057 RepID=UPI001ED9B540|nr:hypothetical protein [Paenisporosarcina sp. TG-14]
MVTIQGFPLCFAEELDGFGSAKLLLKEEMAETVFDGLFRWQKVYRPLWGVYRPMTSHGLFNLV